MSDDLDILEILLDAPGVPDVPRVNTRPDGRSWLQRTGDRAAARVAETAQQEAARKRDPLKAAIDSLGVLSQPAALALDMVEQGKHPWERAKTIGREIDQFAEGISGAVRRPGDFLEAAISEAPADWLGIGMRGHTRAEKPAGDLLQQLGAALGLGKLAPKTNRPPIKPPADPGPVSVSKPIYPQRPRPGWSERFKPIDGDAYYHSARVSDAPGVIRDGLRPGEDGLVYLSDSPADAARWMDQRGGDVVYRVPRKGPRVRPSPRGGTDVVAEHAMPPARMEFFDPETGSWRPLYDLDPGQYSRRLIQNRNRIRSALLGP